MAHGLMLKEAVHQHLLPVMDKIITGALLPQLLLASQSSCLSDVVIQAFSQHSMTRGMIERFYGMFLYNVACMLACLCIACMVCIDLYIVCFRILTPCTHCMPTQGTLAHKLHDST